MIKDAIHKYHESVPEVQHMLETKTNSERYDLPQHTVTVTEVENVDLAGNTRLGNNMV